MLCPGGLAAAFKYACNKGGGLFLPMRFAAICARQGTGELRGPHQSMRPEQPALPAESRQHPTCPATS